MAAGNFASTYDSRDRELLGRNGWLARVNYFRGDETLGAEASYEKLEGTATYYLPVGENMLYLRGAGGSSFDSDLPIYEAFTVGGPVSFPGLNIGELRGMSYWSAQVGYLHQVAEINYLFGQSLYAGFTLTAGDMGDRLDEARDGAIYSGAFVLGGRTPLGPLGLSIAISNTADWQVVFLHRIAEEPPLLSDAVLWVSFFLSRHVSVALNRLCKRPWQSSSAWTWKAVCRRYRSWRGGGTNTPLIF